MPSASILFELYKGCFVTLREMNPVIGEWKANYDDRSYALEWSNPNFGDYNLYCQPFYDGESNMDIFIYHEGRDDKPYLVANIDLEYLRYAYQKGDISIENIIVDYLNTLRKYINFIEFKITNRIKYNEAY